MKERDIIERMHGTKELLPPLQLDSFEGPLENGERADAFITSSLQAENPTEFFHFLVEMKSRSTPQMVHQAISQIKEYIGEWRREKDDGDVHPMILVPFLSEERLDELYQEQVSGVDLCGNGIVTIPEENLLIYRTGKGNQYPESQPVNNPFKGRTALVARAFFREPVILSQVSSDNPQFDALNELCKEIKDGGVSISLSQVSKAVAALKEKRLIGAQGRSIYLLDPDEIMRLLAANWKSEPTSTTFLRLPHRLESLRSLDDAEEVDWAITGTSAVSRYAAFAQTGRVQVAVSNMRKALSAIQGEVEDIPNFADIELIETDEPGYYFDTEVDDNGIRWASKLQTWIELSNGDARQQDAARDVYHLMIA